VKYAFARSYKMKKEIRKQIPSPHPK